MAKTYVSINSKVSQFIGGHNQLVNKVGDLTQLNTTVDSDIVGAINSLLSEGTGVDSAAIISILDSGEYIKLIDIPLASTASDIVTKAGTQIITGKKIFSQELRVKKASVAELRLQNTTRADSSETFSILHDTSSTSFVWSDSDGSPSLNTMVIGGSNRPTKFDFYTGNNSLVGTIDSAGATTAITTLMTRAKGDTRYLRTGSNTVITTNLTDLSVTTAKLADASVTTIKIVDGNVTTAKIADGNITTVKLVDDAVSRAKLLNDVTLIIYDSAGVAVKTLYGAGA